MIKVENIEKSDTLYCDRVDCDPDRTCPYYGDGGRHRVFNLGQLANEAHC